MATEIVEISGIETSQKVKTKAEAPAAKSCKSNTCKVCGIKTYQKDGMCVLCKTGITQIYEMIESLKTAKEQEGE
jgi:glycerate kinase